MSYTKPHLKSKYYDEYIKTVPSLKNKTIAITGTTSGTGFVAANIIAEKGAKVILLNRNSNRSISSYKKIIKNNPKSEIISITCDLQDFNSVKNASDEVINLCPSGLDVLCNNAGVMALKDIPTIDGFDIQMQTNHLSHFLLTKKLLNCLEKAEQERGEARIVNHSSIARFGTKKLEGKYFEKRGGDLGGNGSNMLLSMIIPQGRWTRYAQTKLANAAFTACLHEKFQYKNLNIKALVAHPGLAMTDLQSSTIKDGGMGAFMTSKMMSGGQTMEDGAIGILSCIGNSKVKSGEFYGPGAGRMAMKGPVIRFGLEKFYNNRETMNLLWNKSCEAIEEEFDI